MGKKYPTVNYIGNKEKISSWIIDSLPINKGTVLDLFCGGCSVSYELKYRGFNVISNDFLYSNYALAKAIIENSSETLEINDFKNIEIEEKEVNNIYNQIKFLENKIYFDYEVKELAKLIFISGKLNGNKKYIFLSLLRRAMIRKIPYSRMNIKWEEIKKFRDEKYSYEKYGRYRHYHNITFEEHICLNLKEYNDSIISNDTTCIAIQNDALNCLKSLGQKVDLIYMDPPYPSTMNKYKDFYGYFDVLFDKKIENEIDFTDKKDFLINFTKLMKEACKKTNYVAISLNNKCYPDADTLINQIKEYISEYKIFKKEHIYKVTGKENKHTNFEILLICKIKGDFNDKEESN